MHTYLCYFKLRWSHLARLDTFDFVERVERVETSVSSASSQSSSTCRASQAVLFDKLDTAKMHGLDTSNVARLARQNRTCRVVSRRAKWNFGLFQDVRDDRRLLRPVQRNGSGRFRARLFRHDGRRSLVGPVQHDPVASQRRPTRLRQHSGRFRFTDLGCGLYCTPALSVTTTPQSQPA